MTNTVFDKTPAGREEIATRRQHLATRLRTLLLLVDGKRNTAELMASVAGLGLDEKALVQLLEGGFIQPSADDDGRRAPIGPSAETLPAPETQPTAPPASPELAADAAHEKTDDATARATASGILREGENQLQALYGFFTETIRSAIGLRGYGMQLKVERASTVADFRALRQPYLTAVLKAKGPELEHSLRNRLDQLLSVGD